MFVAETDAAAMQRGKVFHNEHHLSLTNLRRESREYSGFTRSTPDSFEEEIARQIGEVGINYLIGSFFFGNMKEEHALRSLKLFAAEVMPSFQK
jgi:hypothetical protein